MKIVLSNKKEVIDIISTGMWYRKPSEETKKELEQLCEKLK